MILPFAILAAVPFIMVLGNSMLIPVFPQLERELSLTQFQVGLLVTAFSIPAGIVIPFSGALSDHVGRKNIMFPALILYGVGGLAAGFASLWLSDPYGWILGARILQGIGAGGTYQIALALTGDLFPAGERPKAVGILEAANGFGKVVSPVSGAALGLLIWYAPFFAYGILSIPVAFAVWLLVKEPKSDRNKQTPKQYWTSLKQIFREKAAPLLTTYAAGAVGLFLLFGLLSFVSDELELRHGMDGIVKGLWLALPVAVMAGAAYAMGFLLQDKDEWLMPSVVGGLFGATAGLVGLAFFSGLTPLMVLTSIIGLGIGVKLPALNTLVTGATEADERGLITALYGTVRFFGVALGPPAFGLAEDFNRVILFLIGAGIALVTLVLAWVMIDPDNIIVSKGDDDSSTDVKTPRKIHTLAPQAPDVPANPVGADLTHPTSGDEDPFS